MNGRQEAARFVLSEWRTGIVKKGVLKGIFFHAIGSIAWLNQLT
jgi:hypothetical protein